MTTIQSCDHHDESGSVPDNRSRARMLQQLQAADELAVALGKLFAEARASEGAVVAVPLGAALPVLQAWLVWRMVAPRGDDWHPAYAPPSEIRIPPDPPAPVDET